MIDDEDIVPIDYDDFEKLSLDQVISDIGSVAVRIALEIAESIEDGERKEELMKAVDLVRKSGII